MDGNQDDYLPLSGLQHFAFCRRQFALIHIEQQWRENLRTAQGRLLHERVDDPDFFEMRGGVLTARSVPVSSRELCLSGICDVVEFYPADERTGARLAGRRGYFRPVPVEYKRGKPKADDIDEVQLCAQAICLEEMLCVTVPEGYLYYGEPRRRTQVALTDPLRERVRQLSKEMRETYRRNYTPRVKPGKVCRACSLCDVCLPGLLKQNTSVAEYIGKNMGVQDP